MAKKYAAPADQKIDPNKTYTATIETDRRHDGRRAVSQDRAADTSTASSSSPAKGSTTA